MAWAHQFVVVISLKAKEISEHEDSLPHLLHVAHSHPVEGVAGDGSFVCVIEINNCLHLRRNVLIVLRLWRTFCQNQINLILSKFPLVI